MSTSIRHKFFSPARIAAIAGNTFLELVRLRVFFFLLIFALFLIGSAIFGVSVFSFDVHEQLQLLKDVSLGTMSIFTWLLAMLATAMLLPKDVEDRTLYTILAKPVPRLEYLIGKLAGVLLMLAVSVVAMSLLFAIALYARQQMAIAGVMREAASMPQEAIAAQVRDISAHAFNSSIAVAIGLIFLKAVVFAAITLFVSTFASSIIFTVMISAAIYLIGHLEGIARDYWIAARESAGAT